MPFYAELESGREPGAHVNAPEPRHGLASVGEGTAWGRLLVQARILAPFLQLATVEGEPGSGKQTLARYLHQHSAVGIKPFHRCDAREWLIRNGSSAEITEQFVYLDRVDLLTGPGQVLLLSLLKELQDRSHPRLVLVCSSQTSLRQSAGKGLMLPDLAFRLSAVRLVVPPLRDRCEDIEPLAECLLRRLCAKYQQLPPTLAPGCLAKLKQHDWPGNVSELASVLESALVNACDGLIRPEDLPLCENDSSDPKPSSEAISKHLTLDHVIQQHVRSVLERNGGNKLRSARQLGISRSTLYRILANQHSL